jgi:2-polyprenyl-3-methyl-5-hydroxy-6-metoxy-1,4-benzoquinol methylase
VVPICSVCRSVAVRPVNRHLGADTKLYRCTECGLAFCSPLPDLDSLSAGPNSLPTDPKYTAGLLDRSPQKRIQYQGLAEGRYMHYSACLHRTNFRILEVGCGSCGMAATYNRLGVEYWGIDIDPRVVGHARESGIRTVSHTDLLNMPVTEKYDVICFSQVLEHIKAPRLFLDKVASLLSSGGIVHCDVPNHKSLPSLLHRLPINRKRWGAIEYPHHLYAYTRHSLHALFSASFAVKVFDVTVDDPVWGQAIGTDNRLALLSSILRSVNAGSLLVAYGVKKAAQDYVDVKVHQEAISSPAGLECLGAGR